LKFGVRTPSLKKSFKARTTGRIKRSIKKAVIPGYGKKGMGWIKNPKKAAYNAVYHQTTIGIPDLVKKGTKESVVPYSFTENVKKSNLDNDNGSLPANNFVPTDPPEPPNDNGSKRRGCIIKIVIGFIVICILSGIINSCSGGSNSATSSSRISSIASSRMVSSKVSSTVVSSATSSKVVSSSKAASSAPVSPSSAPAAIPQPEITITKQPGTVSAGSNASISIQGSPNTSYSITVVYSSGTSTAAGLEPKTSNASGNVSWTWKVGTRTKAGSYSITISGGGVIKRTSFTVVR
jgi:hypothetical protein